MKNINLHILKASCRLTPFIKEIKEKSKEVIVKIVNRTPISNVDIIFYDYPERVIPELGICGYASSSDLIFIYLNSGFNNFKKTVNEEIERTLAHEIYHCLRLKNLGYGKTLLEALVFEGLADHFDVEITNKKPNLWDIALTIDEIKEMEEIAEKNYANKNYNYDEWFFGSKKKNIPKWTGYTLGFNIVRKYLENNHDKKPSQLYAAKSEIFI